MRVYADTSVFGGAIDLEFEDRSKPFFALVRKGAIQLVVSAVVLDELECAPAAVKVFFESLIDFIERVEITEDADTLQQAYLKANIVAPKWEIDALHVAVATVSDCKAIVSWNFKHIVNSRRIALYNEVNQKEGFNPIAIHTPFEVILNEEE